MNLLTRYTILLFLIFPLGQGLNAQSSISGLPKPGFEKRIQNAVNAIRLIDTHEHLMSETEALASPADFSTLFTNYQVSDLISSGMAPDKAFNTLKGKEIGQDAKWLAAKDGWANMRTTAYGLVSTDFASLYPSVPAGVYRNRTQQ